MIPCDGCGRPSPRLVRYATVEERALVDGETGEFVEVLDADTKDVWRHECCACAGVDPD